MASRGRGSLLDAVRDALQKDEALRQDRQVGRGSGVLDDPFARASDQFAPADDSFLSDRTSALSLNEGLTFGVARGRGANWAPRGPESEDRGPPHPRQPNSRPPLPGTRTHGDDRRSYQPPPDGDRRAGAGRERPPLPGSRGQPSDYPGSREYYPENQPFGPPYQYPGGHFPQPYSPRGGQYPPQAMGRFPYPSGGTGGRSFGPPPPQRPRNPLPRNQSLPSPRLNSQMPSSLNGHGFTSDPSPPLRSPDFVSPHQRSPPSGQSSSPHDHSRPPSALSDSVPGSQSSAPSAGAQVTRQRDSEFQANQASSSNFRGDAGKQVDLISNYVRVLCKCPVVYQFCCEFRPEIDSYRLKRSLVLKHFGEANAIEFDGKELYSRDPLTPDETTFSANDSRSGMEVEVRVKFIKPVPWKECPKVFNLVIKNAMKRLSLVPIGRGLFDEAAKRIIREHKLQIWPGYVSSIDEKDGGLLVNVLISHRVLRDDTVYDLMIECTNRGEWQNEFRRQIVGEIVLTRYNNRTYRVDDVSFDRNPTSTFPRTDGQEYTFVEYYRQHYNKSIRDLGQPMLLHRPKRNKNPSHAHEENRPIELVPELCYMTGLTQSMRDNFRLMKDVGYQTRLTPDARARSLRTWIQRVKSTPEAFEQFTRWGLDLCDDLYDVGGRVLDPVAIRFGENARAFPDRFQSWSQPFSQNQMYAAVKIPTGCWAILFTADCQSAAHRAREKLIQWGQKMGMTIGMPEMHRLQSSRNDDLKKMIDRVVLAHTKLVVAIFSAKQDARYKVFKKTCMLQCPVASQVILRNTLMNQNKVNSVAQKIAGQINAKLGGELWRVDINLEGLMVCGYDAYHNSASGSPSAAAFTASLNSGCTLYFSTGMRQSRDQELVAALHAWMAKALEEYKKINHNSLPQLIVVYRDGVSDGQLSVVADFEIPQLMRAFSNFGADYRPEFVFIVVQKRINSQIFLKNVGRGRNNGPPLDNPQPGTVVDDAITKTHVGPNFLLVSQHVRQGTVTPTHYIVLKNESTLKANDVQRLTYQLTHLYYNWCGTVRSPAPCVYADRLAGLIGAHLDNAAENLSTLLYYL